MSRTKKGLKLVLFAVLAAALTITGCKNSNNASTATAENETTNVVQKGSSTIYQWGDQNFEQFVRKAANGRTLKIGFTPPAASEFYDIIEHGANTMMNELSDRFGVKFEFEMSAPNEHQSVESQVATIENWTAKKYDAIMVSSAGDFDSMNAVYQKAMDAGTAIFMFNMPAEMWEEHELNAVSVIGYNNNTQSGYIVGKYAAEKLHGKGKILLVWGLPGHWSTSRKNGFLDAIKEYPDMQIVGEQRGDYVRDKGMQAAENLLQANPDVNLIYGENEEMAQGAVQAVEAQGLKLWDGTDGIMVIGADGLKSGFDSIRDGKLTATVNVGAVDMGREFIKSVFMSEVLGYTVDKIINVPTTVIDKENVDVAAAYTDWALGTKRK
ncbi:MULTISPECIES: sugar ABC transporter substrate-binding protein [unclassified Paenibacillus]|uniref:sugar ABC transporter substrate-binding protein n=1 Tax=unclassified Paenibacillus TaxID=185978 RepID=UPI0024070E43|nr:MULTISPECIES: sugar ABC transporter substrate-binding protein [unclassified Paenibacillus]MDF9841741.1 ABC-type sugar transport system substrate-binding protein [Paenibacillus sp. PastF-2]MDF9848147.1 ABC-type sugar transport system substrate-binding protein [Paenibacillus sp. PastM-2]MDF9854900.1 ABC-type sugar transport system substrate-binding protein [Paenibacillus sp. PastF-1]MDH6480170.1 ABC-type sugar transport system substrate-binding protein [Paenibacillus sp. PastH-2]MDH6507600.1 